jgi:hypothetical protein
MSRISTMLTVYSLLAGTAPALAERDLGLHRIDGPVDLIWTAREDDDSGHWIGGYSMRGRLDRGDEGNETLLGGWDFRCDGLMSGAGDWIAEERGSCRFEDEAGRHFVADFAATPGPWSATLLRIGVHGGSDTYRTVRGEGTIERQMRLPFAEPVGWGFLTGAIAWRRD